VRRGRPRAAPTPARKGGLLPLYGAGEKILVIREPSVSVWYGSFGLRPRTSRAYSGSKRTSSLCASGSENSIRSSKLIATRESTRTRSTSDQKSHREDFSWTGTGKSPPLLDRKSTRLNSSHGSK